MSQQTVSYAEGQDEASDLFTQLKAIAVYKWQIAGIAAIFVMCTALVVFSQQPIYRAVASVLIEYRQASVLEGVEVYETGAGANSYYATQITVMSSRDMVSRAVDRIDWSQYPDFLVSKPGPLMKARSWLSNMFPAIESLQVNRADSLEPGTPEYREQLINAFMASVKIVPVVNTQLVQVHFLSTSRELAMEGANALSEAYIDSGFEAQFAATKRATEWLNSRLVGVKSSLESSEKELQRFRETQDIVNIGGGRAVLETELADNMQRLRDAERQKTLLQNTYAGIRAAGANDYQLQQVPSLLQDELVRRTKEVFLAAQNEVSELSTRYGPKHPTMIKARAKLAEAASAFYGQLRRAADNVKGQFEIAARNVESLSRVVEETRRQIRELDRQDYKLQILRREADTNSQLYNTILKRFKEADVAGDFQPMKARIIDAAVLPKKPYKPNKRKALTFAGFFGLLIGGILAVLRNHLDTGIKTGDELEGIAGLPVYASIPAIGRKLFGNSVSRLVENNPKTPFSEGVRTIRTGILLADLDKQSKKILVTSAMPQEGKSSIASNLALAFSQVEKVLLVDCDFRKPNLARYMGAKGTLHGMGELLQGKIDKPSKAVYRVAPNVDLLSVGKELPSPGQVLTSSRFAELLDTLAADYDRIIIDSAPCHPVSDSLLLAKYVDGVVFVVRYDSTPAKLVQTTLKRLAKSQAPILGLVLNRVDPHRATRSEDSYYYGKGYYG